MFKSPFSFEGRIKRTEYGLSFIMFIVVFLIITVIIGVSKGDADLIGIAYVPMFWFLWAQGSKRCHDIGNDGWCQLIPYYGFWLLFKSGDTGPNKYGDNPKDSPNFSS